MQKKKEEARKLELEAEKEADEMADLEEDAELPLKLEAGGVLQQPIAQLVGIAFHYPGDYPLLFQGLVRPPPLPPLSSSSRLSPPLPRRLSAALPTTWSVLCVLRVRVHQVDRWWWVGG